MGQLSIPWDNNGVGDAQTYDSNEWAFIWQSLFLQDPATYGVVASPDGLNDELDCTETAPNTITVEGGVALVAGKFFMNTANVSFNIPTSAHASGRYYRIVARAQYLGAGGLEQTVRLARIDGVEGGAAPAVTQTFEVTWELPLWKVHVTNAGVITLTDERKFVRISVATPAVDDVTINYNGSDELQVKDAGLTYVKLAAALQALLFNRANYELSDSIVATVDWTLPANTGWNDIDTLTLSFVTTVVCDLVMFCTVHFDDQVTTTGGQVSLRFDRDGVAQTEVTTNEGGADDYISLTHHSVFEAVAAGAHTIKAQVMRTSATPTVRMESRRLTVLVRPKAIS